MRDECILILKYPLLPNPKNQKYPKFDSEKKTETDNGVSLKKWIGCRKKLFMAELRRKRKMGKMIF